MCYALSRLAGNIQEPFRTLPLQASDASIQWWNFSHGLEKIFGNSCEDGTYVLAFQVPCHVSILETSFIKHSSVVDILCNHKAATEQRSIIDDPVCSCSSWTPFKSGAHGVTAPHWVLILYLQTLQ